MKRILFCFLILFCAALPGAERKAVISGKPEKIAKFEIVRGNSRPLVDYAANELQSLLKEATGMMPKIVDRPTQGAFSLILGDCEPARKAGADLTKLPEEGFYIIRKGNQLFITGNDSLKNTPARGTWSVEFPRGTLTGIYDFSERFAGIRFFFPGPMGTIIPRKDGLYLPEKIDILDFPEMYYRRFSMYGKFHIYGNFEQLNPFRKIYLPRVRESEKRIVFAHGLNGLDPIGRFGKTHPEYFALLSNGTRHNDPKLPHSGQLCFSSGIREEIYQDLKAYFTGKPASGRGMKNWSWKCAGDGVFCIMPQDGMIWCRCEKCAKIWKGNTITPEMVSPISTFMFRFFAELSTRLTKEGIPHKLSTMAYFPYKMPPAFPLPKELLIQVAVGGRGGNSAADQSDTELLKSWYEKTGNRVSAWTYAMGKHMNKKIPGVPAMMPRHAANFIKTNRKYLAGVYFESETDHFLFNYLNYYIIQKLMWNPDLDAEALLDEHFKLMFGKGAPFMQEFFAGLEENWTEKILGKTVETAIGPMSRLPSTREIWGEIYSAAKLKHYSTLFDKALAAAKGDAGALRRLNFIRKEILGSIEKTANRYHQLQQGLDFWIARCPGSVWLRPFAGEVSDANTKVTLRKVGENLIVRADCEEPCMKKLASVGTGRDDPALFSGSEFEILLNPSGDRKNFYQFDVNPDGVLCDYRVFGGKYDITWNSTATAKAGKTDKSWWAEVTIPLKEIGSDGKTAFPANFARNRAWKGQNKKNPAAAWSMWSLYPGTGRGFHDMESWGKISFEPESGNLIKNSSLEIMDTKRNRPQYWYFYPKPGAKITLDDRIFISGGQSIRIDVDGSRNISAGYKMLPVKPNCRYRLSYFLKTENLTGKLGAGAWIYFFGKEEGGMPLPRVKIRGTNPWHRVCCEFTAPARTGENGYAPVLGLWVWNAKGTAWFDEIHLEEL